MKKHWRAILIVVLLLAAGGSGFLIYRNAAARQQTASLQTAVLQRGTLTASIGATGTIQAKQQAVLSFAINGRVGNVNVHMGDRVTAGQVLIELDPDYYPQSVISAQIDLINAQKALDDLKTSQTALAQAELDLANAKQALDTAQTDYNNTVEKYNEGWVQECRNRADQAYRDWMIFRFHNDGSPAAMRELARLYQAYLDALKELEKAQQYYAAGVGSTAAGTKEAQMNLEIAKAKLDLAQAQYDDALAAYNRLKDGVPAQDLAAAQARVDAAQATINQVKITAPFAGTILSIELLPGDIVTPGTVGLVVADLSEMHVNVPIAEVDYNSLALGQTAELVLDAIPNTTYHGTVEEISLDAANTAGSVSYPVKVVLADADSKVLPGMTVAVNIEVSHLDDILLVPNRAVRTLDGSLVVYTLQNGVLTPVTITLGASNDTMSQVLSGDLKEGDVIVLNPPSSLLTSSGGSVGGGGGGLFR
jgi:HlyD family secretion protein